jgi:hypothetical protein
MIGASAVVFVALALLVGVGLVALLAYQGTPDTWQLWSAIGQTFGALSALLSGVALVVLVGTFRLQHRELKGHQGELAQQRTELYRSAEAQVRMLHLELIKLALSDQSLAEVWPAYADLSPERRRQYLYANLILQQLMLQARIMPFTDQQVEAHLRHLFQGPVIREYWAATRAARKSVVRGSAEEAFSELADRIWYEYETLLRCSYPEPTEDPTPSGRQARDWEPPESMAA